MRKTVEASSWQTTFDIRVNLGTGLTRREQIILFNSARHCEVHKLLGGEIEMNYQLEQDEG